MHKHKNIVTLGYMDKMVKIKTRYRLVIVSSLIYIVGFLFLSLFIRYFTQSLVDSNGVIIGTIGAAWFIVWGFEIYLLLILIISFIGFLISKYRKNLEYYIGFKYQTLILLLIWLGFNIYWFLIKEKF